MATPVTVPLAVRTKLLCHIAPQYSDRTVHYHPPNSDFMTIVMDIDSRTSAEMLAFHPQNDLLLKCYSSFKGCGIPSKQFNDFDIQPAAENVLP